MKRLLLYILAFVILSGCGKNGVPVDSSVDKQKDEHRVQIRLGGDDNAESPHLAFKITAIYDKQKPFTTSPFHIQGGEWTFFDCEAISDSKTSFIVGVMEKRAEDGTPSSWGRAVLAVKDQASGAQFVELFASKFSAAIPQPAKKLYVPQPLFINTAVLGNNMNREAGGGFSGKEGHWTATKWFPEMDEYSAEVYFNFDLDQRIGEFSEKDAEYADDLVVVLATALRNGPRPERTPENDPNLVLTGPAIGKPHKFLSHRSSFYAFSPKGRYAVCQDRTGILFVPVDEADSKPTELVRFEYSPWEVHVLNEELDLLVQEGVAETPPARSSADPMRIWWVDQKGMSKKLLRGPEKDLDLADVPSSPDRRFVAMTQWSGKPGKDRVKHLIILDRETDTEVVVKLAGKDLSVINWKLTDAGIRLIAVTNRWGFDEDEPSELFLVDPGTGKMERQASGDARSEIENQLSPDGSHRVRVGKDELIVTEVASGKEQRFIFHQDDRRLVGEGCIEWVSPRYLKFNGGRLALIDVTTMKMSYPAIAGGMKLASYSFKFSADFRWVLYQAETDDEASLYLAPIETPTKN